MLIVTGRNGSGKSSLLKCLAGLLEPAGGRILLNGSCAGRRRVHHLSRPQAGADARALRFRQRRAVGATLRPSPSSPVPHFIISTSPTSPIRSCACSPPAGASASHSPPHHGPRSFLAAR
ncbi:MAG: ATP-binding cassette domain-containing protein [Alphaproteobacteria bacterium]